MVLVDQLPVTRLDPRQWDYSPPKWMAKWVTKGLHRSERKVDADAQVDMVQGILAFFQRHWGNESRPAVNAMEGLAHRLERVGRLDEALILHTSALTKRIRTQGPEHPATLHSEMCVGKMLSESKRYEEAESHFSHVVDTTAKQSDADQDQSLNAMLWLGDTLTRMKNYEEAQDVLERVVVGYRATLGEEDPKTADTEFRLAKVLALRGDFDAALAMQRNVVESLTRDGGADDSVAVNARWYLAEWLHRTGDDAEARVVAVNLVETKRRLLGDRHEDIAAVTKLIADIDESLAQN